ncbi:hypothetical protein D3C85_1437410 [compost metagenome]
MELVRERGTPAVVRVTVEVPMEVQTVDKRELMEAQEVQATQEVPAMVLAQEAQTALTMDSPALRTAAMMAMDPEPVTTPKMVETAKVLVQEKDPLMMKMAWERLLLVPIK